MKEFVISEVKTESAVLVGLITQNQDEAKTKEYLDELEFLADTAGAVTVKRFTQRVNGPSAVTYVGKGKLEEIRDYIKQKNTRACTITYCNFLCKKYPSPVCEKLISKRANSCTIYFLYRIVYFFKGINILFALI